MKNGNSARFLGLFVITLSGCGSPETKPSSLLLEWGEESDTWTADPAPVEVEVTQLLLDGTKEQYVAVDPPTADDHLKISLEGARPGWFAVEGLDASGQVVVRGRTGLVVPEAQLGAPVKVFVGRVGQFNRPPTELWESQGLEPPVALLGDRYLLMAGTRYMQGSAVRLDGYDLAGLSITAPTLIPCPTTGCRARSLVALATGLVVVIGQDWAVWADFSCGSDCTSELAPPDDLESFSEVAGGRTILNPDGLATIVGATRPDEPSRAVLQFHPDAWEAAYLHDTPRAGAAATWVSTRGLLVVGGASEGSGAELWSEESLEFEALPYPSDPTHGAALVAFDARTVLRLGGVLEDGSYAPSVLYDLDCTADCTPTPFGPPIELTGVTAFHIDDSILAFGTNSAGLNESRLITLDGVSTVELREPRGGARAIRTASDQVAVVGGELSGGDPALKVEFYQP